VTILKLTGEQARDLVYDEADPELGLTVELDEQVASRRWVSVHRLIVRGEDGRLWAANYERGLTEYQDSKPFEDQAGVKFAEVEKVPVTTYEYRLVSRKAATA
jgi:hypothetical protein